MPDSALIDSPLAKDLQTAVIFRDISGFMLVIEQLSEEKMAGMECAIKISERLLNYQAEGATRYLRFMPDVFGKTRSGAHHLIQTDAIIAGGSVSQQ